MPGRPEVFSTLYESAATFLYYPNVALLFAETLPQLSLCKTKFSQPPQKSFTLSLTKIRTLYLTFYVTPKFACKYLLTLSQDPVFFHQPPAFLLSNSSST